MITPAAERIELADDYLSEAEHELAELRKHVSGIEAEQSLAELSLRIANARDMLANGY